MEKSGILTGKITQTQFIKNKINVLLDAGEINKKRIYSMVTKETNIPRSTIRRTARQMRFELIQKLRVLCDEVEGNKSEHDTYYFVPKHIKWHFDKFFKEDFVELKCMICKRITGFCQKECEEPIICNACKEKFPEKKQC